MRLLVLYPNLNPLHIPAIYIRLLAKNMEAVGHTLYGDGRPEYRVGELVPQIIERLGPFDGVLCLEPKYCKPWVHGMNKIGLKKGMLLSDYVLFKRQVDAGNRFLNYCGFDILFHHTLVEGENLKRSGRSERAVYLPFGVDTTYLKDLDLERDLDVCATWNDNPTAYPDRLKIKKELWASGLQCFFNQVFCDKYVNVLNRSKICICSRSIDNNIQSRFMEAAACGAMILTDPVTDLEIQGWVENKHLVIYRSVKECVEKAKYYASHEEDRQRIANQGRDFVIENFRNEVLIQKIVQEMEA
jgi:hypothetical protein